MILFKTSFITLISFAAASWLKVYDGMVVSGAVFICSVNYWRRPAYGWRRNIDIANTVSCLAYQTWRCLAVVPPYAGGFLTATYTGVGFYFLGLHLDKTNIFYGTLAHALVHLLGNIGNIILYTGLYRQGPALACADVFQYF
jgi:hypothetical protein